MIRTQYLGLVAGLALAGPVPALEDPTRPDSYRARTAAPAQQQALALESIMVGPRKRVAVIDGVARREGERFDGLQLLRVYPDRVTVRDQGRTRVLHWTMPPRVRVSR